jgi:hypothetical protein
VGSPPATPSQLSSLRFEHRCRALAVRGHALVGRPNVARAAPGQATNYCCARHYLTEPGRLVSPSELGRKASFGPMDEGFIKSFFVFQIQFKLVQILEIHIYSNICPKFMKPVRFLNSSSIH